jgi:hypothetical protein
MKKWLRWQGIAAFVVVSALLAGVWMLVVDRVIQGVIEKAGTKAVGAKVELGAADLTLFPLGLTLSRLQVTDPDEPMVNVVEVARIAGSLDGLNLLRRKVIIKEMAVVAEKIKGPLAGAGDLGDLEGAGRELAGRLNLGEDLLKSAAGGKAGISAPLLTMATAGRNTVRQTRGATKRLAPSFLPVYAAGLAGLRSRSPGNPLHP